MRICNRILFIILVAVFCCNCEQAIRNLVSSFQISETSIGLFDSENLELHDWDEARESTIYRFEVCLEDKFQSRVIRHQKFQVHTLSGREIPLSGNGLSDINGCLKWTEQFPYENNAANDYYIYCERIIKPLGTHYGVQKWSWAIDVHPEGNFYDSHEVGDFYPWIDRKNQKYKNVINCDSDVHQNNSILFAVSKSYEEAFGLSGNPLLLSSTSISAPSIDLKENSRSPLTVKYELAMNLKYRVKSTENIEEQREVFTGKYRVRGNLVAVLEMENRARGEWNQCVYLTAIDDEGVVANFQDFEGESATNELRVVDLPIYFRFMPPGILSTDKVYLQLEVEPVDKPENVHLTKGSKWFSLGNVSPIATLSETVALSAIKPSIPPSCAKNILEVDWSKPNSNLNVKKQLRHARPFEISTKPLSTSTENQMGNSFVNITESDLKEESSDISFQKFEVRICVNVDSAFNNTKSKFGRERISVERVLDQRGLLSLVDNYYYSSDDSLIDDYSSDDNLQYVFSFPQSHKGLSQIIGDKPNQVLVSLDDYSCIYFKDKIRYKLYDLKSPYLLLMYKVKLLDIPNYSDILVLRVPILSMIENISTPSTSIPTITFMEGRKLPDDFKTDEPVSLDYYVEDNSLKLGQKKNEHLVDDFLNLQLHHSSVITLKPIIKFGSQNSSYLRRGFYFLKFVLIKEQLKEVFEKDRSDHIISYDKIYYHDGSETLTLPFDMTLSDYKLNFTYNELQAQLLLINDKKMILAYYMAQLLGLIETSRDHLLILDDLPTEDSSLSSENFTAFNGLLSFLKGDEIELSRSDKLKILNQFLEGLSGSYTLEDEMEELNLQSVTNVEQFINEFINSFLKDYVLKDYGRCGYRGYAHLDRCTESKVLKNILGHRDPERIYFDIDNFRKVKKYLEEFLARKPFEYLDKANRKSIPLFLVDLIKKSYGFLSLPIESNIKSYGNVKKITENMSNLFKLDPEMKKWVYKNSSLKSPVFQFLVRLTPMQWVYKAFDVKQESLKHGMTHGTGFIPLEGLSELERREERELNHLKRQLGDLKIDASTITSYSYEEALKALLEAQFEEIRKKIEGPPPSSGEREEADRIQSSSVLKGEENRMDLLFQRADRLKYEKKLSMCYMMLKPFSYFGMRYASFDFAENGSGEEFFPISSWCYEEIKSSLSDYLVNYSIQSFIRPSIRPSQELLYKEKCEEFDSIEEIDLSMIQNVRDQAFELLKILKLNNISVGCTLITGDSKEQVQRNLKAIQNRLIEEGCEEHAESNIVDYIACISSSIISFKGNFESAFGEAFDKAFKDVFLVDLEQQGFKGNSIETHISNMIDTFEPETLFGQDRYEIKLTSEELAKNEFRLQKIKRVTEPLKNWVYIKDVENISPAHQICKYLSQNISFSRLLEDEDIQIIDKKVIEQNCIKGFEALKEDRLFLYSLIGSESTEFHFLRDSPFLILSEYRVFKVDPTIHQVTSDARIFYTSHSWATENARTILLDSRIHSSILSASVGLFLQMIRNIFGVRVGGDYTLSLTRQDMLSHSFYLNRKETDETRFSNLISKLTFKVTFKEYEKCLKFIKNPKYAQEKQVVESIVPTYHPPMDGISKEVKEIDTVKGAGGLVICGLRKREDLEVEESYFYVNNANFRDELDMVDYTQETSRPRILLIRGEELTELFTLDLVRNNVLSDANQEQEAELEEIQETYKTLKDNYFLFSSPGVYPTLTQYSLKREGYERWLSWQLFQSVLYYQNSQNSDDPLSDLLKSIKDFVFSLWSSSDEEVIETVIE